MLKILEYNKDDTSKIFERTQLDNKECIQIVGDILEDIKQNGDKALFAYAQKFDKQVLTAESILVTQSEIDMAYTLVSSNIISSIKRAKQNILDYHSKQTEKYTDYFYNSGASKTSKLGWIYRPLSRVGLYVPGGKASYPSTVLMTALPAIAAGVEEVVVVTPNIANPAILVACNECGIKKIYKIGGAQAIGALAYGTKSVPKVDLIAGPGNVFVTLAKKMVFGQVAIDMIAGPSEILVIADDSANPLFVASDLLSQAEHDELAASILITPNRDFAKKVAEEIDKLVAVLQRRDIITKSLENNGAIIVVKDIAEAISIADKIAPEHLELCVKDAQMWAMKIKNAGAIFVGNYSPEPLGDYFAGPSHVLPTSGSARYSSVLSVDTFMKKISYINYSQSDLLQAADDIINIAQSEGFTAHANTILVRK